MSARARPDNVRKSLTTSCVARLRRGPYASPAWLSTGRRRRVFPQADAVRPARTQSGATVAEEFRLRSSSRTMASSSAAKPHRRSATTTTPSADAREVRRVDASCAEARTSWATDWAGPERAAVYAVLCRAALRQARTDVALSHSALLTSTASRCGTWTRRGPPHADGPRAGRAEAGIVQHRGRLGRRRRPPRRCPSECHQDRTRGARPSWRRARLVAIVPPAAPQARHDCRAAARAVCIDDRLARTVSPPTWSCGWPTDGRRIRRLRRGHGSSSSSPASAGPIPSYAIHDAHGRGSRASTSLWPTLGVFLEFDGRVKYEERRRTGESLRTTCCARSAREELICELTGWLCIRLIWADLQRPADGRPDPPAVSRTYVGLTQRWWQVLTPGGCRPVHGLTSSAIPGRAGIPRWRHGHGTQARQRRARRTGAPGPVRSSGATGRP